jgi:hypothetical protein
MRKGRALWVAQCVSAFVFAVACAWMQAYAQSDIRELARRIYLLTNGDRAAQGLQKLQWNADLAAAAQTHAERMAEVRFLSHQYTGEQSLTARAAQAGAHFQAIAENIATGYSSDQIENEWMHSTAHRTNILDPRMNAIGVGVVVRDGTLYAVEDFAESSEAYSPSQVESRVGGLLRRLNIDPSGPHDAALLVCSTNSGYPKGETGKLVIRFDTPDLSQLPGQVQTQIESGHYRSAAVAVCSSGSRQGSFTSYRVAIVLY